MLPPVGIFLLLWIFGQQEAEGEKFFREGLLKFDSALKYRRQHPTDREEISRRFLEAADLFVKAWKAGARSTNVLTNAGNSFYFAGDEGQAVLYWKRALAVDPGNERARAALEAVRRRLPFRRSFSGVSDLASAIFLLEDPRSFLWRFRIFCVLFPAAWLLFSVELARRKWPGVKVLLLPVFPFALLAALLGYLFRLRRPYGIVGTFCLIPALAILGSLVYEGTSRDRFNEAVVLVEVQGRRGNGLGYSLSHSRAFPPGTEVRILEERSGDGGVWSLVRLPDGSTSWIPSTTLARVIERETGEGAEKAKGS